ncbi:tetratricopeptide repeat protein [bacterium]|nr:tetratricopeptide repeat protein [bacterium]
MKQKVVRRAPQRDEEIPQKKRNWVVRVGIGILGFAVLISSLVPLLSIFDRGPQPVDTIGQALPQLEAAAKDNPKDAAILTLLGNSYYDLKRYPEAAATYTRALAIQPDEHNVRVDYGTALFYSGRTAEAKQAFEAVIAKNPDHLQAHLNLGVVLRSEGQLEAARTEWTKAQLLANDEASKQHLSELLNSLGAPTR